MSGVRRPCASTCFTAASMRSAASGWSRLKRSIMAADRIVASGLATPLPAMSGAEPCDGSYRPLLFASSDADGSMPIEP
eukprot:41832-Eustigmatos_ZCMA.PRE.1